MYDDAEYIYCVAWGIHGRKELFRKILFDSMTIVEFEGHDFSAISNWDKYLSSIYGDYMELPPENERVSHGVQATWV